MADEGNYKFQLSKKLGNDMLNIRADSPEEFDGAINYALTSENPEVKRFFDPRSDTARAAEKVQQAFPGSQADPETPNCTVCGGATKRKPVNTKNGQRIVHECLQERGPCLNDRGYPNSIWGGGSKGRDA